MEELGEDDGGVLRRGAAEGDEEGLVAVVGGVEFVHEGYDLGQCGGREDERACEDGVRLRVSLEGEFGHDAEVLACAADRPEQVCVVRFGGGDGFA